MFDQLAAVPKPGDTYAFLWPRLVGLGIIGHGQILILLRHPFKRGETAIHGCSFGCGFLIIIIWKNPLQHGFLLLCGALITDFQAVQAS